MGKKIKLESGKSVFKWEIMVELTKKIIELYEKMNMKISVRQCHYRILEMSKDIPGFEYQNTDGQVDYLSEVLTDARDEGKIPFEAFVDRTREVHLMDDVETEFYTSPGTGTSKLVPYAGFKSGIYESELDPIKTLADRIDLLREKADRFSIEEGLYQPSAVVFALEKQAQEDVFLNAIKKRDSRGLERKRAFLAVLRGQASTTQKHEFAMIMKNEMQKFPPHVVIDPSTQNPIRGFINEKGAIVRVADGKPIIYPGRELHLKIFRDLDPWGEEIEKSFLDKAILYGARFASIESVALTGQQVLDMNLKWLYKEDMPESKQVKFKKYKWPYPGVVELDAIEPRIMQQLINEQIDKHRDKRIYQEVKKLEEALKRQRKKYVEKLIEEFNEAIEKLKA